MKRDRVRRFTVGLGHEHARHLRVLAADEKTRKWADRNGPLMNIVLWKFEQEIQGLPFATDPSIPASIAAGETPASLAQRFGALARRAFPDESIDVRALTELQVARV